VGTKNKIEKFQPHVLVWKKVWICECADRKGKKNTKPHRVWTNRNVKCAVPALCVLVGAADISAAVANAMHKPSSNNNEYYNR
jgi:hypothetical protein